MWPILVNVGSFTIYSYGVMVAIGFALGLFLAVRRGPQFALKRDEVLDLGLSILIGGIVGARLFYVIINYHYFLKAPFEIFDLAKGGLVYYGALVGALVAGYLTMRLKQKSFWDGADLWAPSIALGQSIGRVGCFLNGCCYGTVVDPSFPLGLAFPGERVMRHPTELYESCALLAISLLLFAAQARRRFRGETFLLYGILYGLARFCIDFFRGDVPRFVAELTLAQLMSGIIVIACAGAYMRRYAQWNTTRYQSGPATRG